MKIFLLHSCEESAKLTLDSMGRFKDSVIILPNTEMKAIPAMRHAMKLSRVNNESLIIIRSGTVFEDIEAFIDACDNCDIAMPTILNPNNSAMELSLQPSILQPHPTYVSGTRVSGTEEVFWVDGPCIYISNKVVDEIGLFDPFAGETFIFVDYCIRARWVGFNVNLIHSTGMTFVNKSMFSGVLSREDYVASEHIFYRKYNGDILGSLINE